MTITESIKAGHQYRLDKLKELKAPAIILTNEQRMIDSPEVKGLDVYGNLEFSSKESAYGAKAGRYTIYHTAQGPIALFSGRFGRRLKPFESIR